MMRSLSLYPDKIQKTEEGKKAYVYFQWIEVQHFPVDFRTQKKRNKSFTRASGFVGFIKVRAHEHFFKRTHRPPVPPYKAPKADDGVSRCPAKQQRKGAFWRH